MRHSGPSEWRIAEITDPSAPAYDPTQKHKLEWNASWESGELTEFASEIDSIRRPPLGRTHLSGSRTNERQLRALEPLVGGPAIHGHGSDFLTADRCPANQ